MNILLSYRELEGVQTALTRINRRIKKHFSVKLAMETLKNIYDPLTNDFKTFFPCLIDATESYRRGNGTFLLPSLIN